MSTRTIKITFQGASRDVELSDPFTLGGLQQAIASTFDVDEASKNSNLSFTYKDPEGDDIVFDKDSELSLALRLCPSPLDITAVRKETAAKKHDPERKLYQLAARNLREYNGVPSMTPDKLAKTLVFLQLNPRRLVRQGLAPKALLVRVAAAAKRNKGPTQPLGGGETNDNSEDLADSVADGMQEMGVEDDKKEWDDGFASAKDAQDGTAAAAAPSAKKRIIHEAFIAAGIQLRPREVRPLLLALDVRPHRLVKLGYVDGKELRAVLEAEKRANAKHMARGGGGGGPCGPPHGPPMAGRGCGARGGGGLHGRGGGGLHGRRGVVGAPGAGGPGMMGPPGKGGGAVRHRPYPVVFHLPPPPPAQIEKEVKAGGGGGRRGARLDRPQAHRHPHLNPRNAGLEEGAGGPGPSHHGQPRGMPRMRQAPGGGAGQQQQRGCYWG